MKRTSISVVLQYLGSKQEADKLLEEAKKKAGLYELLKVPIILLITSVLYNENEKSAPEQRPNLKGDVYKQNKKSLPERRTELYENLYQFIMDRSTLKPHNFGRYSSEIPNIQTLLQTLGKFAWEALQRDVRQLYIEKVSPNIEPKRFKHHYNLSSRTMTCPYISVLKAILK